MKEVGRLIENLLRQKKMWNQYKQNLILIEWPEVIGEKMAAVTRAEKILKGKLFIAVKDSTWAYHLTLLKPQILDKINQYAGRKIVDEIYFRVGEIEQENDASMSNNNLENHIIAGKKFLSENRAESFLNGIRKLKGPETLSKQSSEEV